MNAKLISSMLTNWLTRSNRRASTFKRRSQQNQQWAAAEVLEIRQVPAATAVLQAGVLTITGSEQADNIVVTKVGTKLAVSGVTTTFTASSVRSIVVNAGGGDDTVDLTAVSVPTKVSGGAGNDSLTGGSGKDTLMGESGNDVLTGNAGNDSLDGGVADDVILGGDGRDSLVGNGGNDSLEGGAGDDNLNGGVGDDLFAFSGNSSLGQDVIAANDDQGFNTIDFSRLAGVGSIDLTRGNQYQTINGNLRLNLGSSVSIDQVFEMATASSTSGIIKGIVALPQLQGQWWMSGFYGTQIRQTGTQLEFQNERGETSIGTFVDSNHVVALQWNTSPTDQTRLHGTISLAADGFEIRWDNGTVWTQGRHAPFLAGQWWMSGFYGTQVREESGHLTFINEHNQSSTGTFLSGNRVVAKDWGNLEGAVVYTANGYEIRWTNGTTWSQQQYTQPIIGGQWWLSGFQGTRIEQTANGLTFINENGSRVDGEFLDATHVVASGWNNLGGTIASTPNGLGSLSKPINSVPANQ